MSEVFDIQTYMTQGVERVVKDAVRATLKNPRESAYMVRFAAASKEASKKRARLGKAGEHVPPFLIASITSSCNLHCDGCYSRCNNSTTDDAPVDQLTDEDWSRVFDEAEELGVSFILLAGGEPMLRKGVIEAASEKKNILFPVFTNGTYMTESFFNLFDESRNIVPIMSIEGEKKVTVKTPKVLKRSSKNFKQTNAYKVIKAARKKLGCAYVSGAEGPRAFDCSGYTYYIYNKVSSVKKIGTKRFSRNSAQGNYYSLKKYDIGRNVKKAQPGDIMLFSRSGGKSGIYHAALYYGNGKIIHASSPSTGVIISYIAHRKVAAIIRLPKM